MYWLFSNMPQLDLAVSHAFYSKRQFWGHGSEILQSLRMLFWNLSLAMVLTSVIALSLGYSQAWPQRVLPMRDWNVILWGFLLGPGILVNVILKGFSGRPRPRDTFAFGGDSLFKGLGEWDGRCVTDCSFVSGEVSGTTAFCLSCVILIQAHSSRLGPRRTRALYAILAGSFAFVFLHRIMTGGHYLSDAVMAALLTALVMVFVAVLWPQPRR